MIHLLDKLQEKYQDIRGQLSGDTKLLISSLRNEIAKCTKLKQFEESEVGKILIKNIQDLLVAIDQKIDDGKDTKELLAERRGLLTVLQTMSGGRKRLKTIEMQIEYYLNKED